MKLIFFLIFILTNTLHALDCIQFEDMAIQQNGRVKPLYVHARESIKYLTGKYNFNGLPAIQTYCDLSVGSYIGKSTPKLFAPVEHVQLIEKLNVKDKKISYEMLSTKVDLLEFERRRLQETESSYKKAVNKAYGQLMLYQDLKSGSNWMLPIPSTTNNSVSWVSLAEIITNPAYGKVQNQLPSFLDQLKREFLKRQGDAHLVELKYFKLRPYHISMLLIIIALFLLVIPNNKVFGLGVSGTVILLQTAAIAARVYISGRAPITNMYETVLFSGYGGLVIAHIIGHIRKDVMFVIGALGYNFLCCFMLVFAHGMLNPIISPLVPVLRDNFWLSTHVTTVILSYAAFAVSWVIANIVLFRRSFGTIDKKELRYQTDLIYSCLKVGSTLLALGIILGGVWADYSWGRFWGWDPKETWSAIALLIYLAIMHGKYTSWIKDDRFVPMVAGAFMSIMMAWFGVNYILASGLHSYGFSEGGAIFLGAFFAVQTFIIIFTTLKTQSLKST